MAERSEALRTTRAGENGALLVAAGGLAAAFAAASCCALPLLLSAIGIGSAGLGGIALLAAPYQRWLLLAAAGCVLVGGGLLWRNRAAVCLPGTVCARPGIRLVTTLTLTLAAILALLGYAIA